NSNNNGNKQSNNNVDNTNNMSDKKSKWSSFKVRFIVTWSMIFGFFGIIYLGHIALIILLSILQILSFREIAKLGVEVRKEKNLPGFYLIHWILYFAAVYFIYGELLLERLLLAVYYTNNNNLAYILDFLIKHHAL